MGACSIKKSPRSSMKEAGSLRSASSLSNGTRTWHAPARAMMVLVDGVSNDERSCLADVESQYLVGAVGLFQDIAGMINEIRDVDGGKGVRAFDHQHIAGGEPGERLAGAQRRQRALEAAEVH